MHQVTSVKAPKNSPRWRFWTVDTMRACVRACLRVCVCVWRGGGAVNQYSILRALRDPKLSL